MKYDFIEKEEIDSIIEKELDSSEKELEALKSSSKQLKDELEYFNRKNEELASNLKITRMQNEGLNQKVKFLQNTLEESSKQQNEKDKLKQEIANKESDYIVLQSKYLSLNSEIEIYKKSLKKNFNMEKEIKELTDENEKLSYQLKLDGSNNDYREKCNQMEKEIKDLNEANDLLQKTVIELRSSNQDFKEQNEEKFKIISQMQNELKLKTYQYNEKVNEIGKYQKEKTEINSKLMEFEYKNKVGKMLNESKSKELIKELDKLVKTNELLKKENNDLKEKLMSFQTYTNFANTSKETLTKKDFSMLETMARRVEEAEGLAQNLKELVEMVNQHNLELKEQLRLYEYLICYYMKTSGEFNDILDKTPKEINEMIMSSDDYKQIIDIRSSTEKLMAFCFKVKEENCKLLENIQTITMECNQRLRKQFDKKSEGSINGSINEKMNGMEMKDKDVNTNSL